MRTLLAAVLAALALSVPGPATAAHRPPKPKPCPHATVVEHTKRATAVFTGTVGTVTAQANGAKNPDRKVTTYTHTVAVDRIYQGHLDLTGDGRVEVVTTQTADRCSLGRLTPGQEYVFFSSLQGKTVVATLDSGTALAGDALVAAVQQLLGPGQDATPPPPATATFTRVADSSPPRLTRLLAPGAALVLIGLLGLAAVGRLGRRAG